MRAVVLYYNQKEENKETQKKRRLLKMMTCITITAKWFNDVKDSIPYENPYFYNEKPFGKMVEVDVDEEAFINASKEKGWM